jgi:hypothetical protein
MPATVDQLLPALDRRIELLGQKLEALTEMRRCMRQGLMEELVKVVCGEAERDRESAALDERIEQIRCELARRWSLAPEETTLGRVAREATGPVALALSDRRERLQLLLEQVRSEADMTARLVQFALDFNSKLLGAIAGQAPDGHTYEADGSVGRNGTMATFQRTV